MWPCTMKRVDAVLSSSCTEDPSGKLVLGSAFHVQHMFSTCSAHAVCHVLFPNSRPAHVILYFRQIMLILYLCLDTIDSALMGL